jgi:hypothetical protein
MALAPLLEVRVILREPDASGTPTTWVVILLIGFVLWFACGVSTGSVPLIISNTMSGSVALILPACALVIRNPEGPTEAPGNCD